MMTILVVALAVSGCALGCYDECDRVLEACIFDCPEAPAHVRYYCSMICVEEKKKCEDRCDSSADR